MNAQLPLTDDAIRAAITRRATSGAESDLRALVLAATATVPQRRGWRIRVEDAIARPERRTTRTLAFAIVLLLAAALGVAVVGLLVDRPAQLGGLAYVHEGDLYVAGPAGESPRLVWDLPATEDVASRQLVWVDQATVLLHNYGEPDAGVSVVDVVSGTHRLLDTGTLVALSPDHTQVAALRHEVGASPQRLRIIDLASGALVAEFQAPIRDYPHGWSPDGRWLLGEMPDNIYKIDVTTGELTVLVTGLCCGLSLHSPGWSPDGTRIVYVDYHLPSEHADCFDRCGTLWTVDAAGGVSSRVTPALGSEILPAFSPDGRWIAYVQEDHTGIFEQNNLEIIAIDGTGRRVLMPSFEHPILDPGQEPVGQRFTWDPDSRGLSYLSRSGIWHVTLDGDASRLDIPVLSEFARQVVP